MKLLLVSYAVIVLQLCGYVITSGGSMKIRIVCVVCVCTSIISSLYRPTQFYQQFTDQLSDNIPQHSHPVFGNVDREGGGCTPTPPVSNYYQ